MKILDFKNELTAQEQKFVFKLFWITWFVCIVIYFTGRYALKIDASWFSISYDIVMFLNLAYFLVRTIPSMIIVRREIKQLKKELDELGSTMPNTYRIEQRTKDDLPE